MEKPRNYVKMSIYAFYISLYPIVQELDANALSKKENIKVMQNSTRHSELEARKFQRDPYCGCQEHALASPCRANSPWWVGSEWRARKVQRGLIFEEQGSPQWATSSPQRVNAAHNYWWRGWNPMVKKAQLSMASCNSRTSCQF